MKITPSIEKTADGSATLRHPVYGCTYHSVNGAVGEARHVFIENGLALCTKESVNILEAGLGGGLNAWLAMEYAALSGRKVHYRAVEKYPVATETAEKLGYTDNPLFMEMHRSPWNETVCLTPHFSLHKEEGDLTSTVLKEKYDVVFFDAFAPDDQPELWTAEIFLHIYESMNPGGILVTYSAKGIVKNALREAGFTVSRPPGAMGKRHMVRAVKPA